MEIPPFPEARLILADSYNWYRRSSETRSFVSRMIRPTTNPEDRYRRAKKTIKKGSQAYSAASKASTIANMTRLGLQAANIKNFGVLAAATVTGASATGFGLLVVGGVMFIGEAVKDGVAWKKTKKHVKGLKGIRSNPFIGSDCYHNDPDRVQVIAEHNIIMNQVLPYIIAKKSSKQSRKAMSSFGAILGGGLAQSLRGIAKAGWKSFRGTKGVNRKNAAMWLAHHFVTHDCELADSIVAELYSHSEMNWLKTQRCDVIVELLMEKMKST